ncbi:ABC transporter ATP-binding protein [Caryophanon tenue]|uniref:Multidrug ABC transporter ATP-binding protein n=1 Tax=Caryophanon tenue TaxID=33978 RepID=A0A1C0Y7C4_9BACL|nr:ABC transporter ATP-binding protein [Caryophanon tenue]OCS83054.1 multidrug ABC transporter ATP-binding protein [Caryophanon tenue]
MLRLLKYLAPYKAFAILGPLFMVVEVAMDLLQPTIMQHIIDDGIANNDEAYVYKMFGLLLVIVVVGLIGGVGCSIFSTRAAINFSTDLRRDLYDVITVLSVKNKEEVGIGKLITNLTSDVETLQKAVLMMLKIFVRGPLLFIGAIIVVYFTARELFPLLLILVPILMVLIIVFTTLAGKVFTKVQQAIDSVNTYMQENLAGVRVIKAFNRSAQQMEKFGHINYHLMKRNIRAEHVVGILSPLSMFVINIGIMAALWSGAIKVEEGILQVGVILAFINYLTIIMNGIMSSSNVLIQIARAIPSAKRINTVMDMENSVTNTANASTTPLRGDIRFDNVSFYYYDNGEYVLEDISFHVKPGETLGIIGMTGSGKSTLTKLLPRLYDAQQGQIYMDNQPIQQIDLTTLRQAMGIAPQKATLFSGTIADNLRYGAPQATASDMALAMETAVATEFVSRFDDGVEHHIAQGGKNLSGGQRQRLAMARAFVRRPKILVLDDSTSAVDAISERHIQQALAQQFSDTTTIIVASKIASIQHADHILVLEHGKMVGLGTHEELVATNAVYRDILATQQQQGGVVGE